MARVDTFADVLAKYETHPEAKSLGPNWEPCGRGTVGLLRRRPVTVGTIILIRKESNRLEERSRGELRRSTTSISGSPSTRTTTSGLGACTEAAGVGGEGSG